MNKKIRGLLASVVALVACLTFVSSAAALTISPAGTLNGTAGSTSLSVNGITLTCASSTINGSVSSAGSGSATAIAFNTCRQASLGTFTVTATPPWTVTVTLSGGNVIIRFGSVSATIRSSIGCQFTVSGSQTITVPATSLPITISSLSPNASGSALTVSGSTGCLGLVNNGNAASFIGTYALSAAQTISG